MERYFEFLLSCNDLIKYLKNSIEHANILSGDWFFFQRGQVEAEDWWLRLSSGQERGQEGGQGFGEEEDQEEGWFWGFGGSPRGEEQFWQGGMLIEGY